ncbi:MAG: riboflavin synthase, partial [Candidatus Dadabacteria bacterium]|nr:riboflavin synthase [Candidatus Dadabacteria bacterium]
VDGVSLTVNSVAGDIFSLNVVPHTAAQTLMVDYQLGTKVHLEVDIIARYMERLLTAGSREKTAQSDQSSGLDLAKLAEFGFLK